MPLTPFINFRVSDQGDALAARGPLVASTLRAQLVRYLEALARELAVAAANLTEAEASLIVDAMNGTLAEPHTVMLLWAQVEDACRLNHLDRKWTVDCAALVAKLRGLSYTQTLAVVDAAERFWNQVEQWQSAGAGLRAVGLVR